LWAEAKLSLAAPQMVEVALDALVHQDKVKRHRAPPRAQRAPESALYDLTPGSLRPTTAAWCRRSGCASTSGLERRASSASPVSGAAATTRTAVQQKQKGALDGGPITGEEIGIP
jgi:hypothetical protein